MSMRTHQEEKALTFGEPAGSITPPAKRVRAVLPGFDDQDETVLVVDDDEAVRKLAVRILSRLGHKVLEAEGPAEAMRLASATPIIHLLLTDFSMPEVNGLE